jgi:hypothetical protein
LLTDRVLFTNRVLLTDRVSFTNRILLTNRVLFTNRVLLTDSVLFTNTILLTNIVRCLSLPNLSVVGTFVGKRQFQKGAFIYFIILNTNRFEKSVTGNIQDDCCKSVPIISYAYAIPIASTNFNYKHVLHDLNIDDFKSKPPD